MRSRRCPHALHDVARVCVGGEGVVGSLTWRVVVWCWEGNSGALLHGCSVRRSVSALRELRKVLAGVWFT